MKNIVDLHSKIEAAGIPIEGVQVDGDRYVVDYASGVSAADQERGDEIALDFATTPAPDWDGLVGELVQPNSPLREAFVEAAIAAGSPGATRLTVLFFAVAIPSVRSIEALVSALNKLDAAIALTDEAKQGWNALVSQYDFPVECRIEISNVV